MNRENIDQMNDDSYPDPLRSADKPNRSEVDEKNQPQSATVVEDHRWYKSSAKIGHDHLLGDQRSRVSNDHDPLFLDHRYKGARRVIQGRQQRVLRQDWSVIVQLVAVHESSRNHRITQVPAVDQEMYKM